MSATVVAVVAPIVTTAFANASVAVAGRSGGAADDHSLPHVDSAVTLSYS